MEVLKGTLMQIWKSANIFVSIWKEYVQNFILKSLLLFEIWKSNLSSFPVPLGVSVFGRLLPARWVFHLVLLAASLETMSDSKTILYSFQKVFCFIYLFYLLFDVAIYLHICTTESTQKTLNWIEFSHLEIIFMLKPLQFIQKHNFEFVTKRTGSYATLSHVFFKDLNKRFKFCLSVLLKSKNSFFHEHLIMAAVETIWRSVLKCNSTKFNFMIKMYSAVLQNLLFPTMGRGGRGDVVEQVCL